MADMPHADLLRSALTGVLETDVGHLKTIFNSPENADIVFRPIAGNVPSIALLMAWKKGEMKPALRDFIAIVQERLARVTA